MAPKRKKQQVEEEEKKEETTTESPAKKQKLRNAKVDPSYGSGKVYNDGSCVYDCMLNQTNIAKNNNKFYVIQLIEDSGRYVVFTRWGRVGETGQTQDKSFSNTKDAIKEFCAKFKSKTANNWADRDSFTPKSGKYTMVDIADDDEEEEVKVEKIVTSNDGVKTKIKDSALEPETQELINLIFSNDMFKEQLVAMNIDVEKMPLGKLSKEQIKKGFQALEKLKTALDENDSKTKLAEYTSAFYTVVPHNFGRKVPPVISSQEALKQKVDLLNVLSDMTIALEMKNNLEKKEEEDKKEEIKEIDNPIDQQYKELNNTIKNVDKNSELYKILETYYNQTKGENKHKLLHIFSIDREGEKKRHDIHKDITNRKLLWHGTNVAVVCAILKTGLRIMPHSGGRVGKGIYFASENAKSAGYVGTATDHKGRNIGIMFLNEVALGKIHQITKDDSSLKAAPEGYDSILAKGQQEPDESKDTTIDGEYGKIIVPQGKPKETHNKSSFYQSEYLVYQESQVRMKYLLMFQWERGW